MIGSRRKTISIYKELEKEGFPAEKFAQVHAPVGLEIGAVTPEEIAVAIVAEMIAVRRRALPDIASKKYEYAKPQDNTSRRSRRGRRAREPQLAVSSSLLEVHAFAIKPIASYIEHPVPARPKIFLSSVSRELNQLFF